MSRRRNTLTHTAFLACSMALVLGSVLPLPSAARATSVRETLAHAVADSLLPAWQRAFFASRLAGLEAAAPPALAPGPLASPEGASTTGALAPIWSRVALTPALRGLSLVVDSVANRVLVFGGSIDTTFSNEVYTGSLAPGSGWHRLTVDGPRPAARTGHVAFWDAAAQAMVVYGGIDIDGSYLGDLWILDLSGTPRWIPLAATGAEPVARTNAGAVFDAASRRGFVAGGSNGGSSGLADCWTVRVPHPLGASPTADWTSFASPLPAALRVPRLALDPVRRKLVLAGLQVGQYTTQFVIDTLGIDAASPAWTPASLPGGGPYSFDDLGLVVDPGSQTLHALIENNSPSVASISLADFATWSFSNYNMSPRPTAAVGPAIAFDPGARRLLFAGGAGSSYSYPRGLGELWALRLPADDLWTQLLGEPGPRTGHALAYDPLHDRMFLFGGSSDTTAAGYASVRDNDLWQLSLADPATWSRVSATGGPLVGRDGATLIVDTARNQLVLFGGSVDYSSTTNEVWTCPLAGAPVWSLLTVTGTLPHQRAGHAAVYDAAGDRMVIFGGADGSTLYSDVWALSFAPSPHWTKLAGSGVGPLARTSAGVGFDPVRRRMWIVGGTGSPNYNAPHVYANDTWQLDLAAGATWTALVTGQQEPTFPGGGEALSLTACVDTTSGSLLRLVVSGYNYPPFVPRLSALRPGVDTAWVDVGTSGVALLGDASQRLSFDPLQRRAILYGGTVYSNPRTFALSLAAPPLAVGGANTGPAVRFTIAPNPARGPLTARFVLARPGRVTLELFDTAGRRVAGRVWARVAEGPQSLGFADGATLGAGLYFARLSGAARASGRVVILR